nr:pentatricopeptide repeat-containing protein [Quercus suber]
MSILGNLCKTKSLPVLSKSSRYAVMIDDLPLPPHFLSEQTRARRTRNYNTISSKSTKFRSLEDFFISTLVAAGSCKNHCGGQSGLRRVVKRPYDDLVKRNGVSYFRRGYASKIAGHQRLARPGDWHRKQAHSSAELKEIVNTYHADSDHDSYHSGSDLWSLSKENSIKTSDITSGPRHFPLARRMVLSPEEEDLPPYTKRVVLSPVDHRHALRMRHLNKLLHMKFGRISLDKLWDSYQALQTPRLRYLTENTIRRLFAHLAWVEYKHKQSAHDRFFALLEECLGERITVQADEWNSAIAFAGRQERDVSIDSIRAAVETWMRMEEHGVTATHGTFNILFDLAVKAGRFALADTIYNELISRGLRLNRFFRSSLIYYAGMRGDGDAVRQAFRDLVNAGEIVDTVVMNCVIKSLINAGEPAAAENVFIKMKRLHEQNLGTKTPTDWQDLKALGHRLDIEAQRLQEERTAHESSFFGSEFSSQDRKEEVQRSTPIAPNERTYRILITYHAQTSGSIDRIRELLAEMMHMKFGRISLDKLWDSYQALQTPRLRYLTENTIRRLFAHLAWVEYKHKQSAHDRFFALLEECLGERITVQADEWNSAIAFAGRQERDVSIDSIRAAVETWMRMEEHGVTATHGTFNILFDLAVKAGRFALADTIYNELISRGLRLNRFFRSSLIYYAGMRGDGDAVRQAFRDLVNAGEIVDTVVMNCVIKSLINAGEPAAAENVFIKMKRLHEQNLGTKTPTDWQDLKALGHRLDIEAQRLQEERTAHESSFFGSEFSSQDRKEEVQRSTPIAPNERTYRILITYHAQTSGSIDRIRELLAEMDEEGLNIHGSIYYHLFGGYWQHGGYATSLWTKRSLEVFWREFLQRVKPGDRSKNSSQQASEVGTEDEDGLRDESMVTELERPPYFMRDLVLNALAAFYKCAGRKRMLEVWADVQRRWRDMTAEDRARIKVLVDKFVQEDSIYM